MKCPNCEHEFQVVIPSNCKGLNVICPQCTEQIELKPRAVFGWKWPKAEQRKRHTKEKQQ